MHNSTESKIIFLAYLDLMAILHVWFRYGTIENIIYFEGQKTPLKNTVLRLAGIRAEPAVATFGSVTEEDADFSTLEFMTEAFAMVQKHSEPLLYNSAFLKRISGHFKTPKRYFLNHLTNRNYFCHREWRRIYIINWYAEQRDIKKRQLLIRTTPYTEITAALTARTGVDIQQYWQPDLQIIRSVAHNICTLCKHLLSRAIASIKRLTRDTPPSTQPTDTTAPSAAAANLAAPAVCRMYTGKRINTVLYDRNEFHGFAPHENPYDRYIISGYNRNDITPEDAEIFAANNIEIFGSGPQCKRWTQSATTYKNMARLIATMTVALFIPGVAWNRQTLSHFIEGVEIAKQYSLSVDFLNQQNIKVFIIENNPSSGLACALDTCNCVGVIYQTSISHVGFSSFFYRTGMDVHFTYSSLYQERLKKLELKDTQIIPTGYVYDYALNNAPLPDALIELQASLKQQGASKIIVWFLENSLSHWTTQMHPEKQIQLIGEVLKSLPDNHFLIIKPKHVQAFKDYVGCEESLADLVKEHVNLVMLTPSNAQYDTYPFHFARIADACIGDLIGGTAGMEAAMTNCPVYLLDHCAMQKNYPIESVGNLSFVYTDCNKLGQAIASQDKTSKELTADWEAFIQRQVEFLDGNASKRIIDFIDITIEEFTQETDKQAVLERATNRYHARWSDVYNDKKQQIA